MLLTLLGIANFSILLFFGIFVSAAFLGIEKTRKNNIIMFLFGVALYGLQTISYILFGLKYAEMLYPLITHLPLLLLFTLYFKQKVPSSLFAILSAYLSCQLSKWFGVLAFSLSHEAWIVFTVRIATTIPIWYVIVHYAAKPVHIILSKSRKTILIFGILPAAYYLFDYIATVYTNLLYSGSQVVFEFLPFILCVAYLFFSVIYFNEYEEKCKAEQQKQLIEIQTNQSIKEIAEIKRSEYEISLIRHDMRHFLSNVSTLIENKDYARAQDYIQKVIEVTNKTAVHKFCENKMINMIVSSYESRMKDRSIRFEANVAIPAELPCSELEITSILSNGLENAINAVSELEQVKRSILLTMCMNNNKLLLSIVNPYAYAPAFKDGLPVSEAKGHGLGTKSIQYMTAKLNGNCHFTAENGMFTLRVVC